MLTNGTPGTHFPRRWSPALIPARVTGVLPGDGPTTLYLNDGATGPAVCVRRSRVYQYRIGAAAAVELETDDGRHDDGPHMAGAGDQRYRETAWRHRGRRWRVKPVSSGGTIPPAIPLCGNLSESVTSPGRGLAGTRMDRVRRECRADARRLSSRICLSVRRIGSVRNLMNNSLSAM